MRASYGGQHNCPHLDRRAILRSTMSCWRATTPLPSCVCRTCAACLLFVAWLVEAALWHVIADTAYGLRCSAQRQGVGASGHRRIASVTAKPSPFAEIRSLPSRPRCPVKVNLIRHLRARAPPSYTGMWPRRRHRCSSSTVDRGAK